MKYEDLKEEPLDVSLKNCTPHDVVILNEKDEVIVTYPPTGILPRLKADVRPEGVIQDNSNLIPFTVTYLGETQDLPDFDPNVMLIVSRLVADANPDREDLVFPNEVVRNDKGQIIGCRSLSALPLQDYPNGVTRD